MIEIKQGDKLIKIEKGNYILVYNPNETSNRHIDELLATIDDLTGWNKIEVIALPSFKPESIRFLKAEETVTVKGEEK